MKRNKTLPIIVSAAALYFLFVRARTAPATNSSNMGSGIDTSEDVAKKALKQIFDEFGREKTKKLEQLYRKETAHFTSGQYKGTGSPGMEPSPNSNRTFPYGWSSLKSFATQYGIPENAFYIKGPYTEGGTGKQKYFIGFPDVYTAMLFVMYVIGRRGWNFGKWRAFDETISSNYNASLNNITARFTNTF